MWVKMLSDFPLIQAIAVEKGEWFDFPWSPPISVLFLSLLAIITPITFSLMGLDEYVSLFSKPADAENKG